MKKDNTTLKLFIGYLLILWLMIFANTSQAQTSTPYFCCDSITYNIDPSQGFNISLDTTNIIHNPDSMEVLWQICNSTMCYSGSGMYDYFPQILTTDTVKVCYDVMIWESGVMEVCTRCDWLVFDQNSFTWILYNMGNPTGVNELEFTWEDDGITYDLMGRKLVEVNVGQMYIKNNKKYIRIK